MEIFVADCAILTLNKECNSLELSWKKESNSEDYQKVVFQVLRAINDFKVPSLLSDATKLGIVSPADRLWLEFYILPEAITIGLRNVAAVVPNEVFVKNHFNSIKKAGERMHLNMCLFSDLLTSREWLSQYKPDQNVSLK
jgi:hypothetical protein